MGRTLHDRRRLRADPRAKGGDPWGGSRSRFRADPETFVHRPSNPFP